MVPVRYRASNFNKINVFRKGKGKMSNYPYQFKTPEEVFAATDKRIEKYHDDIKAAIIAHLDVLDPVQLQPLYMLVRATARKEFPLTTTRVLTMIQAYK